MIASILIDKITDEIKRKHKNLEVPRKQIKQCLWVFYNAQIYNPAFDSQTKETLTSHPKTFGFFMQLTPEFIKKVISSPIILQIIENAQNLE
jgi:DNA topoisomerase-2